MKKNNKILKSARFKGFTLVELLVTLSVLSILVLVAIPSFKTSTVNNRIYGETDQIVSSLSSARAEALRRNDFVSLCVSANASACSSGADFSTGSILFLNSNKAGLSASSQIIKINDPWQKGDKGKTTATSGTITFGGDGRISAATTILICQASYNSYTINVAASGNIKTVLNVGDGGC